MTALITRLRSIAHSKAQLLRSEADLWLELCSVLQEIKLKEDKPITPPPEVKEKEWGEHLTSKEAAEYMGVRPGQMSHWRHQGGGPPFVKYGRMVRYSRKEIDKFLSERTYPHTSAYVVEKRKPWLSE